MRALLATAALVLCAAAAPSTATVERRLGMMGTTLEVRIEASDRETALAASEKAVQALEAAEARLSTWKDDTELARLNRSPVGRPMPLSPALARDLEGAEACRQETNGTFDPAIGSLIRAWGLRGNGRIPTAPELREARATSGMETIRLHPPTAVRTREGVTIEEGGFGKGAGLAEALAALAGAPGVRATLDLGGQIAVLGAGTWTVAVADPRERDRPVLELTIDRGSVSTSGNSERGIEVGGRKLGHLLDPRTGEPAPDAGSITVWTADPLRADCLSTGLYVMGPEAALAWVAAHPGVEVLALVPRAGGYKALASPGLEGRLAPLARDVEIEIWKEETPKRSAP